MRLAHVPIAFAAMALPFTAIAQDAAPQPVPKLSLEQQTALRCSAAFALVSMAQAKGRDTQYPQLGERGREFFVRSAAQIMEEQGLDREALAGLMQTEAARFKNSAEIDAAMPACLLLLDASGL